MLEGYVIETLRELKAMQVQIALSEKRAARLREERNRKIIVAHNKGISTGRLGKQLGMSRAQVSRIATGKSR